MKTSAPFARLRPIALAATTLLTATFVTFAVPATAQTGPWSDGEIIVRSTVQGTGQPALFRVVPETGATAMLTIPLYFGGWSGSMAFDSHRGGLLANVSLPPDNTFFFRLWLISHDGTASAMPGFSGDLKALASAGDGRIFFVRHTSAIQGPTNVEYFDANNVLHTLKQSDGVTPFQADVEHLLYHAPSNALIGSSTAQWAATHCSPTGSSLYRIPLSADGLRVNGPVTCISIPLSLLVGDVMSLDHMPDGKVLVTTATGFLGSPHRIIALDPVTLAVASWADPIQSDLNGGVWSARLGRPILHANSGASWWEPEGLRTYGPGSNDYGVHLPTSLPIPAGGGFGPQESITEVDLNGPACQGIVIPYGAGLVGNGGFVPVLGAIGCPDIGNPFTLTIHGVVGAASGVLIAGIAPGAVPFYGGTFHLGGPILVVIPLAVGGAPGVANAGSLALPVVLADPILAGVSIYLQGAFVDVAAVLDVSLTNGLRLQAN